MSLAWPWASSGSRTQEYAPCYPAPVPCECCIAGWWHSDMGLMGWTPHMQHDPPPSILHRKAFGSWPQGSPCAQEAQGAVLALGDHAQGTDAGRLPQILRHSEGPTSLCYSSLRVSENPSLQPRDNPYQPSPSVPELMPKSSCREEDWGLDLSGYKPFSWHIRGLISATAAWRKAQVKPEP